MPDTKATEHAIKGLLLINRKGKDQYEEGVVQPTKLFQELFCELERCGLVDRLRAVPHYGNIKVRKRFNHTRYDYVVQQLYLHELARKAMKGRDMVYKYSNPIRTRDGLSFSFYDAVSILALVTNIGHFRNTFTASQAAVQLCRNRAEYAESLISAIDDERYRLAVRCVLQNYDVAHMHFLNALILLEGCNGELVSVQAAKELLYMYLGQETTIDAEKQKEILYVYRQIRDIAFLQSDLPCVPVPMRLLCDQNSLSSLFQQLLSHYNNATAATQMMRAIKKLLDDAFYCDPGVVTRNEAVTRKMIREVDKRTDQPQDWETLIRSAESPFNQVYTGRITPTDSEYLKLTYPDRHTMERLERRVSRINGVFSATYRRADGRVTLLVSLRSKSANKAAIAFRILKIVADENDRYSHGDSTHLMLAAKLFLHYLLSESRVEIKPYDGCTDCLYTTRGHAVRIAELQKRIDQQKQMEQQRQGEQQNKQGRDIGDQIHEAETILKYLLDDRKDDLCISIPASIMTYNPETGKPIHEFDGMLIFPNRADDQVVFFESKNRWDKPSRAKKDLAKKLRTFSIPFNEEQIVTVEKDVWFSYSIR